ncbi:MAG: hypothetical protein HOV79_31400 [Hamadaea sp.]|nr:hypothetical protein [Hamadaea sp.]
MDVRQRARSPLVTKVGLSVVFGAVTYIMAGLLEAETSNSTVFGLILSVFIGGIVFVVQFLVDTERRIDQMQRRLDETLGHNQREITDAFQRLYAATELFGLVETAPVETEGLLRLVRSVAQVPKDRLATRLAEAELEKVAGFLKDLGESGDVHYDGEDRDWLLGLVRVAAQSVDSVGVVVADEAGRPVVNAGLWHRDLGIRYLDEELEAVGRGVVFRQLFVLDAASFAADDDLVKLVRRHERVGGEVRLLTPEDIPGTRAATLFDFLVFDQTLSYESTPATRMKDGPPLLMTRLVTRPDRVHDRVRRFDELWRSARAVPPAE